MRAIGVIYEHRDGACGNALSIILRAVSKNTGLISDLQDAGPVCIRRMNLGSLR